ncbi:MAG: cold shock domain-containing protein [Methanotrichaceae archaeon]
MATGTVKFFNSTKGFGLIKGDDGREYSVHSSGVEAGASIHEGDKVRFEIVGGERGNRANKVEKV